MIHAPNHDVHQHSPLKSGLLIALAGNKLESHMLSNKECEKLAANIKFLDAVLYVDKEAISVDNKLLYGKYLKYHPRREKYSLQEILSHVMLHKPKLIVFDTLHFPNLSERDLLEIIASSPDATFLMAHAFGVSMPKYIELLMFTNVYFDFSATSEIFAFHDSKHKNFSNIVFEAARFLANSNYSNTRLLFGSDFPFYNQEITLEGYSNLLPIHQLDVNYDSFRKTIRK